MAGAQRGSKNPKWKGGVRLASGYRFLLLPNHPHANKNGYVREHVKVMCEHLNRWLNPNEIVHHINGDKLDNRIENLVLMTRGEHASEHHKGVPKPKSRENIRKYNMARKKTPSLCPVCKATFIHTALGQVCCSKHCATLFRYHGAS